MTSANSYRVAESASRPRPERRRLALMIVALPLFADCAVAQNAMPCAGAQAGKVACLFSDVLGRAAQSADPGFQLNPQMPFGTSVISTEMTTALPVPAPASGYVFKYDPSLGTARAERQSYGPIFAERAETIGRHKLSFGFSSQTFVFDKIDGADLHNQTAQIVVGDFQTSNRFSHDFQITQNIFSAIYGVNDRIDISAAIPFSTVDYKLSYTGTYKSAIPGYPVFTVNGAGHRSASGLGDVNVQVKGTILRSERAAVAAGAMVRLPTGDPYNVLGAGAAGIRPFVAASFIYKRVSPHVNVGYLWNGKSVLAAENILSGERRRIPSQFQYIVGADAGITSRLTLAADLLSFEAIHAGRVLPDSPQPASRGSYNVSNGAIGLKLRVFGNVLFQANMLFGLNQAGLRSKPTPLIGLTYEH